ncbi:MAG: CoA-binding protein [Chloroflexota bacterium]|nr:CoA-binding protein [Chloroflexota bacterium]
MAEGPDLLRRATSIVLIDWPAREVPETLARRGLAVVSDDGPERGYSSYAVDGDDVTATPVSHAPERADIVYAYRPIDELTDIIERARTLGARALWYQSGRDATGGRDPRGCWLPAEELEQARQAVESAGLRLITAPYIVDAAASLD